MGKRSHYATSDLVTAFSPWPLESLAPGKVRQDRANGQRPKAASVFVTADLDEIFRVKFMALRLHQGQQSPALALLGIGSKQRLPKLQLEYQRQQQLTRDQGRPTHVVALGL